MSITGSDLGNASVVLEHDGRPLDGTINLPGGKHAFAHVLASAAVADVVDLENVPANADTLALIDALRLIFSRVEHDRTVNRLRLADPLDAGIVEWPPELVARSRNLFCLLPATLHHRGELRFEGAPRGCEIGARPYDWYLHTMVQFGAEVSTQGETVDLSWRRRHPAQLSFSYPTMTGTVVALAAGAAVAGTSSIRGGSVEPSCWEQGEAMTANGRMVTRGEYTTVEEGSLGHFKWRLGPDRIHAATLLTAGLLTRGRVTVRFERPLRMPRFLEFCECIGAGISTSSNSLTIAHPREQALRATTLVAGSEPMFSSDWAPFAALLLACRAEGHSTISDDVFIDRFQFLERLRPAGLPQASVTCTRQRGRNVAIARLNGDPNTRLRGRAFADVPDIRGSAAVLLSALVADGPCAIPDARHLLRGYEDLPGQLESIGVRGIRREETI